MNSGGEVDSLVATWNLLVDLGVETFVDRVVLRCGYASGGTDLVGLCKAEITSVNCSSRGEPTQQMGVEKRRQ